MQGDFPGVHYRAKVAFRLRGALSRPPGEAKTAALAALEADFPLTTESEWYERYLTDWCQNNADNPLVKRKPAVMRWRAWYLRCIHFDLPTGNLLLARWRQFLKESAWDEWSNEQRLVFEGSIHLLRNVSLELLLQQANLLVYAVLSRSLETVKYLLENGFGTIKELHRGESWTGFTALHIAVFIQNRDLVDLLWNTFEANVNCKDLYFGSVLDYCKMLGLVTNSNVYFKSSAVPNRGFDYGYQTLEHICQTSLRHPYSWDSPQKELFEYRNTKSVDRVFIWYWNRISKEMEQMSLVEWSDLVGCIYQPFVSASDMWLDELMFNGVHVEHLGSERIRNLANSAVSNHFRTPKKVCMSYINAKVGFGCYALQSIDEEELIVPMGGRLHSDRYKWKDVEKTTVFRLNFMKQIHDLGEKGRDIIKKPELPRYTRKPDFNFPIPGTVFYINATECGNMARILNHSSQASNARIEIAWAKGAPQALVLATRTIAKGEQILLNYNECFWDQYELQKTLTEEDTTISNFNEQKMVSAREEKEFFSQENEIDLSRARIEI